MAQTRDKEAILKKAKNIGQFMYLRKTGADFTTEMRRSVKVAITDWS
jgi:hypothetical protein